MATAAKKKAAGTNVTLWQQQMAEAAKQQQSAEVVGGSFKSISTRSGVLSVDDVPLKNNELRCVILMSVHENQYYDGPFSSDSVQIPVCYAFGKSDGDGNNLAPHEEAMDKQSEACEGCWANEMGSADTGRGKACKNIRRLALVTEDAMDNLDEAEVRSLKVPVTSVKNWASYVHRIAEEMQRPSWGVVTLVKLVPDVKTQFKLQFSFEELINFDQKMMDGLTHKRAELSKSMVLPYQQPSEDEAPAKKKKPQKPAQKLHQPPARGKPAPRKGKY